MKRSKEARAVKRAVFAASLTAALCLSFVAPLLAAEPPKAATVQNPSRDTSAGTDTAPAQKCARDLSAFESQMQKDGYWLHGSGYGYGYPLFGYGYDHGYGENETLGSGGAPAASWHGRARPGYEVRTLIASANILAESGQKQACEAVLAATRDIYKTYSAELSEGGVPRADGAGWRRKQIAAAQPVTGTNTAYRTDQLIGADVVNAQGEDLGSVNDIVLSPPGKIAYLVIGRGGVFGVFGIGEKYVPVPWEHFKATTGTTFLVLDSTKSNLDAAPRVKKGLSPQGYLKQESQKVDDFWKPHLPK
jgi:sporulation protein YlmC with PRC-barrel domain